MPRRRWQQSNAAATPSSPMNPKTASPTTPPAPQGPVKHPLRSNIVFAYIDMCCVNVAPACESPSACRDSTTILSTQPSTNQSMMLYDTFVSITIERCFDDDRDGGGKLSPAWISPGYTGGTNANGIYPIYPKQDQIWPTLAPIWSDTRKGTLRCSITDLR